MEEYEVLEKIGQGSFGSVYKARRRDDNAVVVLKSMQVVGLSRKEQEDALNEVRILASLSHDNVVQYNDSFLAGCSLHIAMEYCEGGDLHSALEKRGGRLLPERQVWRYFLQVLAGLEHIHSNRVLHRDLKTMNIFLTHSPGKDTVRIGDFGVARLMNTHSNFARTMVGTPYYLSPELCENKPYNDKSDMWALGCVLYELLTLKHPFDAHNQGALILKIIRGKYPPPSSDFSRQIRDLVAELLSRRLNRRPTAAALLAQPAIAHRALEEGVVLPVAAAAAAVAGAPPLGRQRSRSKFVTGRPNGEAAGVGAAGVREGLAGPRAPGDAPGEYVQVPPSAKAGQMAGRAAAGPVLPPRRPPTSMRVPNAVAVPPPAPSTTPAPPPISERRRGPAQHSNDAQARQLVSGNRVRRMAPGGIQHPATRRCVAASRPVPAVVGCGAKPQALNPGAASGQAEPEPQFAVSVRPGGLPREPAALASGAVLPGAAAGTGAGVLRPTVSLLKAMERGDASALPPALAASLAKKSHTPRASKCSGAVSQGQQTAASGDAVGPADEEPWTGPGEGADADVQAVWGPGSGLSDGEEEAEYTAGPTRAPRQDLGQLAQLQAPVPREHCSAVDTRCCGVDGAGVRAETRASTVATEHLGTASGSAGACVSAGMEAGGSLVHFAGAHAGAGPPLSPGTGPGSGTGRGPDTYADAGGIGDRPAPDEWEWLSEVPGEGEDDAERGGDVAGVGSEAEDEEAEEALPEYVLWTPRAETIAWRVIGGPDDPCPPNDPHPPDARDGHLCAHSSSQDSDVDGGWFGSEGRTSLDNVCGVDGMEPAGVQGSADTPNAEESAEGTAGVVRGLGLGRGVTTGSVLDSGGGGEATEGRPERPPGLAEEIRKLEDRVATEGRPERPPGLAEEIRKLEDRVADEEIRKLEDREAELRGECVASLTEPVFHEVYSFFKERTQEGEHAEVRSGGEAAGSVATEASGTQTDVPTRPREVATGVAGEAGEAAEEELPVEDIVAFVYGRIPSDKAEVITKIFHLLYLEGLTADLTADLTTDIAEGLVDGLSR